MAQTFASDEPIPAFLALSDEPLSPEEVEQLADLTPEHRRERFAITDDNGAEWAMRKLARATHEVHGATLQAQEWKRRVDDWLHQVTAGPNRDAAFFTALLEDYALRQRAEGERKSIPLPSGRITTRGTEEPKVTITDETAVVGWVDTHLMTEVREVLARTLQLHEVELPPEGLEALGTHLGELMEFHAALLSRKPLVSKLRERVNVVTTEEGVRVIDPDTAEPVPGLTAEVPEPTATVTPAR